MRLRDALLRGSAAYLLLMWALLVTVLVVKLRTVTYSGGGLTLVFLLAGVPTVAAVALQRLAWRDDGAVVAAVLTSLAASAVVMVLLVVVSLAGD
jgi:hypothetical protein